MASILPGYQYDIFISYRQKDNKHDGWVTEFVDNLKGELESTFKEEISVYFDINPHDGLLETHNVDASLKEKLKCLIFIPIISQTYCDSKSFAWQHEFVAFNNMAKEDSFGRDIKLTGGNVASRILPVKIHDLDPEDKTLLENELSGFIRGIEFIYKEPGVNRPLKPEDDEKKNLNNTKYRNQINKVANAVKEIINAIKKHNNQDEEIPGKVLNKKPGSKRNMKAKIIITSAVAIGLIVLGVLFIPKLSRSFKTVEKSIAVLPFLNYSTEPDQEAMCEGLTDEIINHLFKIKSIDKVVSLRNILPYKGTKKNILQIANELQVNYILDGTYKKIGDSVKIRATLIEPKNDNRIWQDEYDRPYKELIAIQANISLQIADKLNAFLSKSELQSVQKIPTNNQEAYELVQKGYYLSRSETTTLFQMLEFALRAIKLDSAYSDAYAIAGLMTLYSGVYSGSKEMLSSILDALPFLEKALELDQNNAWAHFAMGNINEWGRYDYIKAEQEYLKGIEIEPNRVETDWDILLIGEFYLKMNQLETALFYSKKEQHFNSAGIPHSILKVNVLSGNKKEALDLLRNANLSSNKEFEDKWIGEDYLWLQEYDSSKKYLESSMQFKDPVAFIPRFQAYLALDYSKTKNFQKAKTILNQLHKLSRESIVQSPEYYIGWYYSGIDEVDSAFYWLEKAFRNKSPELPWLKVDPVFNNLKKDPRYWDLYARTGHKAYDDYIAGKYK